MNKIPEHVRKEILSCLLDLADLELQKQCWLRGEGPGPASPGELISQLFDDTALELYLQKAKAEPIFSIEADTTLRELSDLLEGIDLSMPPHELLSSNEWQRARSRASKAARLIEQVLG